MTSDFKKIPYSNHGVRQGNRGKLHSIRFEMQNFIKIFYMIISNFTSFCINPSSDNLFSITSSGEDGGREGEE